MANWNSRVLEAIKQAISLLDASDQYAGNQKNIASVLFYGVPGVGKTWKVKNAVKTLEPELKYDRVTAIDYVSRYCNEITPFSDIVSKYIDYSGLLIIFVDDLEFLSNWENLKVSQVRNDFLTLFKDEPKRSRTLLVGASQKPWVLHQDIIQCFDVKVYLGMPDVAGRKHILKEQISLDMPESEIGPEYLDELAQRTDGFTPADIVVLLRDAIMEPIRIFSREFEKDENSNERSMDVHDPSFHDLAAKIPKPGPEHISVALSRTRKSMPREEIEQFVHQCQQKGLPT